MNTHTLLALGLGTLLTFTITGCKTPPERFTSFGDSSAATRARGSEHDLTTTPIVTSEKSEGITGATLNDPSLSDDSGLGGREHDRTAFANQTVYFEYDHANVKANEASKIDQVAAEFKTKGTGFDLLIEGHCDERGTEEYNRSLGERRALAIRELLMKSGVEGTHIFTRSFGKDKPAVVSHDESAWSKNRRGEFILVLPKKIITTQNQQ
jgi:outer membrane protein OmpA-like peptidoglycan-associated protein